MNQNSAPGASETLRRVLLSPTVWLSPNLLLTLSVLFWAGNFIVGRALRGGIPPISLNFWRWTIALLILLPLSLGPMYRQRALLRREWKLIVALGFSGVAAFHSFVYTALTTTPAVNALLFFSVLPMAIALGAWLVFRDEITPPQVAGIILSIAGALVVIARGDIGTLLALRFTPGDLWMLLAVPSWAFYSVILKRRPAELSPLALLTTTVLAGVAILVPVYVWQLWHGEVMVVNGPNVLGILYVALFASVLAFLFWNRGVAEIGPTKAGMFSNLMPVFGAILAVVFLGESIAPYHMVGALLVFAGIVLSRRRHARAPVQAPLPE